ncbi:MAG: GYD domain-containing protein [Chloroflexi bacterium]|nr:GYD domain-containing protein [Chloroflexota bacterium]
MPLYLLQAAYTSEALAAQIKQPQDRLEAARSLLEAAGARLIVGGYSFGEYDAVMIVEAPDDTVAASFALAIHAGGALKAGKTTKLLTGQEWIASLQKTQSLAAQYRPPQ